MTTFGGEGIITLRRRRRRMSKGNAENERRMGRENWRRRDNLAKMISLMTTKTTTMVALIWHFRWEEEIDEGAEDEQIARDRHDVVTVQGQRISSAGKMVRSLISLFIQIR